MSNTIHAFEFLENAACQPVGFAVAFGCERFLQLETLTKLIAEWGGEEAEFSTTRFSGETVQWVDVHDELASGSLFAADAPRLVIVDSADDFVSRHRNQLETLVGRRATASVLVLCTGTWPANTRLYKQLDKSGLQIDCNLPTASRGKSKSVDEARICDWLSVRAKTAHGFKLSSQAARSMLELNEIHLGLYDQQLAKLGCCIAAGTEATVEDVKNFVGGWRTSTVWKLVDAALEGDGPTALTLLHRLLQAGESALGVFAQISWSVRRYAGAIEFRDRTARQGKTVRPAECLVAAGFNKYWASELDAAQQRLNRLGLTRGRKLLRMLYAADTSLKSSHSADSRSPIILERLIVQIAKSTNGV